MPWTGGMDSPQFSAADLNHDSIKDLFVFDRAGNRVLTFLGTTGTGDTAFDYAPQYESVFPSGLSGWAILHDYNFDSIPDIFTYVNLGTRVFKGSIRYGQLHYDLVSKLIKYQDNSFLVNAYTNINDIPLITDVNRDGDLDILTYSVGGGSVDYYQNLYTEHPGDPYYALDSFRYSLVSSCWGDFGQGGTNNSIELHVGCQHIRQAEAGEERHTGNSLYGFDADNDHDVDLLNGNVGYNTLSFLQNCGDSALANICYWDSLFPSCNVPISSLVYPATFGLDVDKDGYEDLLIAPNVYTGQGNNVKNVLYYRNTNNPDCLFEYQNDSFLVHLMLDYSSNSKPVFYDFNGDGLMDIIVGNYGYYHQYDSTIHQSTFAYLQNTGTLSNPKFKQVTDDYDSFSRYHFVSVSPAFGDLDGDGLPDMIIGEETGYLHFFKNMAVTGSSYPVLTTPQYFNLKVPLNSAPFIFDVNGDSLNDLVVGRNDGLISYYWNFGTRTIAKFHKDSVNANFGGVNVTPPDMYFGNSQPFINKDAQGNMKLYVGSSSGKVFEYQVNPLKLRSGAFIVIDSNIIKQNTGQQSVISIADLNNDGIPEYLLGTSLGGLMMFSDSLWDSSTVLRFDTVATGIAPLHKEGLLHIFPTPSTDHVECSIENGQFTHPVIEIYNILGEKAYVDVEANTGKVTMNIHSLANGFYIIRITDGEKTYSGKILIER